MGFNSGFKGLTNGDVYNRLDVNAECAQFTELQETHVS